MVHIVDTAAISQHCFRSSRRRAAVGRNKKANSDFQMSRLQLSWELSEEKSKFQNTIEYCEEQIVQLQSVVQRLELLLDLKPTRPRDGKHIPSMDAACQTVSCALEVVDATTNTEEGGLVLKAYAAACEVAVNTDISGVTEECVPISRIEPLLDQCAVRIQKQCETTPREIATGLQEKHDAEMDKMALQLEAVTSELHAVKEKATVVECDAGAQEKFFEHDVEADECESESNYGDELHAGMQVHVFGLTTHSELNGIPGILQAYDGIKDKWQVQLPGSLGVKLLRACNLLPQRQEPDECMNCSSDWQLHKNDLHLSTQTDGSVCWSDVLEGDALNQFKQLASSGSFNCNDCRKDTSSSSGCYGYVRALGHGSEWEEAHLLNLFLDLPSAIRCLRCHCRQTPCKYYRRGWCLRGTTCAFMH